MVAKLIEEHKLPTWTMDVTCKGPGGPRDKPGCGSSFTIEMSDLVAVDVYTGGDYEGRVAVFTCPLEHCGVSTDVPQSAVPGWIFDKLPPGVQRGTMRAWSGGRD